MAFKHGSQTLLDIDATGATQIQSAVGEDIALYPHSNIWIKEGTKLIFEGTVPDNFEAKLQATSVTADRDIILPDESGTLATQAYVTSAVSGSGIADTDALSEGSTNLYYTDARTRAAVSATTGSAGYNSSTGVFSIPANTSQVSESGNLYFTNARVDARIPTVVSAFTNDAGYLTSVPAQTFASITGKPTTIAGYGITDAFDGAYSSLTGAPTMYANSDVDAHLNQSGPTSGYVLSWNGSDYAWVAQSAYTNFNTDFDTRLATKDTDNLSEGTNLYYTDARADARITNALGGNVIIGGNLTVSGTTTTVDSNTVNIGDAMITLNSDETGTPSQNGGIEIERGTSTNVQLRFNETTDSWEFTNDGTTYVALGTSATFTGTTDGVNEGSTNLYYTDARADVRATLRINAATTDNISEGSNLYYTNARADARVNLQTGANLDLSSKDTDDLSEGSNLYYTNARARTEIEGADLDLGTNKILYSNVYNTTGDLPSASSYHGMFAHVHGTGKGYFAHAGNWVALANASEVFDGNYDSLTNKPTIPTNNNQLTNGAGYVTTDTNTTYTAGNGLSLSGTTFTMSGSYTGDFSATGDVTAYSTSDITLKENVINITNALSKVQQIRGVEFDWTQAYIDAKGGEDEFFLRKHDTGVIAQEVEEVLPEVVATRDDGTKAVRYDKMVGLLIEAIKEQQSQIDSLKQTIEELKHK